MTTKGGLFGFSRANKYKVLPTPPKQEDERYPKGLNTDKINLELENHNTNIIDEIKEINERLKNPCDAQSVTDEELEKLGNMLNELFKKKVNVNKIENERAVNAEIINTHFFNLLDTYRRNQNTLKTLTNNIDSIDQKLNKMNDTNPSREGGSAKYKYKGRMYKIRTGSRGGKYIQVSGKKIYIWYIL